MKVILSFCVWSVVGIHGMSEDDSGGIDDEASFHGHGVRHMAKTIKRRFSDFLDRQGTFCFGPNTYVDFPADDLKGCALLSPPIANTPFSDNENGTAGVLVDIFNVHNRWAKDECGIDFGTVVGGTVSESAGALVKVKGNFRNALFWVVVPTGDPNDPTLYGTLRAQQICTDPVNLKPSLAKGTFQIEFVNPKGPQADLPDLFELLFKDDTPQARRVSIIANGKSVTGTNVHLTQIGLYKNCKNLSGDCFPSEIVVVGGEGPL